LLPIFWGLDGILLFMPIADILTVIASIIVIINTVKFLDREGKLVKPIETKIA
jgi:hypothetical protein